VRAAAHQNVMIYNQYYLHRSQLSKTPSLKLFDQQMAEKPNNEVREFCCFSLACIVEGRAHWGDTSNRGNVRGNRYRQDDRDDIAVNL
jgi:hypothetical protein